MTPKKTLKMYEKGQRIEFLDQKYLFFSGIFISGIGGYLPNLYQQIMLLKKA